MMIRKEHGKNVKDLSYAVTKGKPNANPLICTDPMNCISLRSSPS